MNGNRLRWLALIVWVTISLNRLYPTPAASTRSSYPRDLIATSQDDILATTLRIYMYPSAGITPAETRREDGQLIRVTGYLERGLGTIARLGKETFIVTHDHWGLLDDLGKVEIRDAHDRPLLEIKAESFWRMVQFRDGGTLLLKAPPELVELHNGSYAVTLGGHDQAAVGDVVLIPNKDDQDASQLTVEAAVVQAIETVDGVPVYTFQNLTNGVFVKGDSGGGVFLDGQLVGNTYGIQKAFDWSFWAWQSLPPVPTPTGLYYAALLPQP